MAYFDVSRMFLDANRRLPKDQTHGQSYTGDWNLLADFSVVEKNEMKKQLLDPWLDAVNSRLADPELNFVFHHHTFDIYGGAPKAYDKSHFAKRPHLQFFEQMSDFEKVKTAGSLLDRGLLKRLIRIAETWLESRAEKPDVRVDFPLTLPLLPFIDCMPSNGLRRFQSVICEVRKDMLAMEDNLKGWFRAIEEMVETSRQFRLDA